MPDRSPAADVDDTRETSDLVVAGGSRNNCNCASLLSLSGGDKGTMSADEEFVGASFRRLVSLQEKRAAVFREWHELFRSCRAESSFSALPGSVLTEFTSKISEVSTEMKDLQAAIRERLSVHSSLPHVAAVFEAAIDSLLAAEKALFTCTVEYQRSSIQYVQTHCKQIDAKCSCANHHLSTWDEAEWHGLEGFFRTRRAEALDEIATAMEAVRCEVTDTTFPT